MKILDRVIATPKAPQDTNILWIDTSQSKLFLRMYRYGKWEPVWCGEHDTFFGQGSFDYSFNFDFES